MSPQPHSAQLDLPGHRSASRFDGWTYRQSLDAARLTTSLQRVLFLLLDGHWHPLSELRQAAGSAADSRLRDLRKVKFGGFTIHGRRDPSDSSSGCWQYRLATGLLRQEQVDAMFGIGAH